jgi:hypothetical protein
MRRSSQIFSTGPRLLPPAALSSFIRALTEGLIRRRTGFGPSAMARASTAVAPGFLTDSCEGCRRDGELLVGPQTRKSLAIYSELDQARLFVDQLEMAELANASVVRPGVSSARTRPLCRKLVRTRKPLLEKS